MKLLNYKDNVEDGDMALVYFTVLEDYAKIVAVGKIDVENSSFISYQVVSIHKGKVEDLSHPNIHELTSFLVQFSFGMDNTLVFKLNQEEIDSVCMEIL